MRLLNLGERVIVYYTEQSLLISLSIIVDFALLHKSYILGFFLGYKLNFSNAVSNIFTTRSGLIDLLILYIISFIYYTIETLFNIGIGSMIFHKRLISKYSIQKSTTYKLILGRNLIKSFFLAEFLNFCFIAVFRGYLQTAYDKFTNLVVFEINSDNTEARVKPYIISSIMMYYSMFGVFLLLYLFVSPVAPTPKGSGSSVFDPYSFFNRVLSNNLSLDLFQYVLGGITLFIGTLIDLFNSTILETVVMSSLIRGAPTISTLNEIVPQFIPETLGYVFGITVSLIITDLALDFFQSTIREKNLLIF